jgi:MoxR-like ATPase
MDARIFEPLRQHLSQRLIGQRGLVNSMLVCLVCDGHMLIEGMPGLAKTTAVKAVAEGLEGRFHRVQFTPDLLPSDLIGTDIYRPEQGTFEFREGPLFHNILLADEINRAPAKVQSALLEAMEERQVTVGQHTYPLPRLFMVLATQNPIEQEGTYHLPEAQLDRFLMHVLVEYPTREEELAILELDNNRQRQINPLTAAPISQADLEAVRSEIAKVYIDPKLQRYIVDLVHATRQPKAYDRDLHRWLRFGASPRASLGLARCARAEAWLGGQRYVDPRHIQQVAGNVMRHRLVLNYEAEADSVAAQDVVRRLLEVVAIP